MREQRGTIIPVFYPKRLLKSRKLYFNEHKQRTTGAYRNTQFLDKRRELINWWTKELFTQGMETYKYFQEFLLLGDY